MRARNASIASGPSRAVGRAHAVGQPSAGPNASAAASAAFPEGRPGAENLRGSCASALRRDGRARRGSNRERRSSTASAVTSVAARRASPSTTAAYRHAGALERCAQLAYLARIALDAHEAALTAQPGADLRVLCPRPLHRSSTVSPAGIEQVDRKSRRFALQDPALLGIVGDRFAFDDQARRRRTAKDARLRRAFDAGA